MLRVISKLKNGKTTKRKRKDSSELRRELSTEYRHFAVATDSATSSRVNAGYFYILYSHVPETSFY
jgi:hypothetical protein